VPLLGSNVQREPGYFVRVHFVDVRLQFYAFQDTEKKIPTVQGRMNVPPSTMGCGNSLGEYKIQKAEGTKYFSSILYLCFTYDFCVTPDHLSLDRSPNIGPLVYLWELDISSVHRGMYCTRCFVIKLVRPRKKSERKFSSQIPKF
jgi:hypothetical protein